MDFYRNQFARKSNNHAVLINYIEIYKST